MSSSRRNKIPRNVVAMGLVSLFNDIASEMVYPIVPIFLSTVLMAPAEIIGLIEGVAESTASLLKIISGWLSDKFHQRKIFVIFGYGLSGLSKLVLGLARSWHFVLGERFMDRFGKGTRESARDALITESTPAASRGRAFGLHRALDSLGAVIGPLLALFLLNFYHEGYSTIFFIAFIPAAIGVLLLLAFVRERVRIKPEANMAAKAISSPQLKPQSKPLSFKWRDLDRNFKIFLFISVIFGIGNSSDAFLILRAQNLGSF